MLPEQFIEIVLAVRTILVKERMTLLLPLVEYGDRIRLACLIELIAEQFVPEGVVPRLFHKVPVYKEMHSRQFLIVSPADSVAYPINQSRSDALP